MYVVNECTHEVTTGLGLDGRESRRPPTLTDDGHE